MMKENVLYHEPHLALFVKDNDPLLFYRAIVDFSKQYLKPEGELYFEINEYLGEETKALLQNDFSEVELRNDMYDKHRMIKGVKNA